MTTTLSAETIKPVVWTSETPPSLLDSNLRQMTVEESELFISLNFLRNDFKNMLFEAANAADMGVGGQIFEGRLRIVGLRVSIGLAMWLIYLSNGSPGNLVLWAWTLHRMKKQQKVDDDTLLTIDDHWLRPFALGVPTEESMSRVWDLQKDAKFHNRLDQEATWKLL